MSELLTLDDTAKYLRVSKSTLKRYIRNGELETIKYGARVVVDTATLDSFLDKHRRQGISKDPSKDTPKAGEESKNE